MRNRRPAVPVGYDSIYDENSLRSLYKRLVRDLADLDIRSAEEYARYRDAGEYFKQQHDLGVVEWSFAANIQRLIADLPDLARRTDGLFLSVDAARHALTPDHQKRLALFAKQAALLVDPLTSPDFEFKAEIGVKFVEGPNLRPCLEPAYRHLREVKSGIIAPVPREVELVDPSEFASRFEELSIEDERYHVVARVDDEDIIAENWATANEFATRRQKLPANFIRTTTSGSLLADDPDVLKIGIILPSLKHLPLSTVLRLREDYEEAFLRFQRALARTASQFGSAGDEERLRQVLGEAEEHVRQLHQTFAEIRKTHKRLAISGNTIAVGLLLGATYKPLYDAIGWAFGILGADFIKAFFRPGELREHMEVDPFFFVVRLLEAGERTKKEPQSG
ncbi:hypothetical protein [Anaeromyxobacter dehalogenans]|uniref:Uncharacterized protein n=1 Tax=Anaeromyxobacter dehalogenans (strain 2CP-C) TaxID=290397 RepID=Q2IFE7_ANADE|nr:hypothetical protein [Anaeromyxobacter dehalogenans]ABC83306.1 hypothetical protein Adeh_3540 [Anaeromyxobacter dehalogenans 2CP-C]